LKYETARFFNSWAVLENTAENEQRPVLSGVEEHDAEFVADLLNTHWAGVSTRATNKPARMEE
jgi:hypothetical protein